MDRNITPQQQLYIVFAQEMGVTDPAKVEALKQEILAQMPAGFEPDKTDDERVIAFMPAYKAAVGAKTQETNPTEGTQVRPVDAGMTEEDRETFLDWIDSTIESRTKRAASTKITAVLYDRPVLQSIIVNGAKLTPTITEKTEENFKKWEADLVDEPANRQAFEQLRAKYMKKEAMDVYVSDKQKPRVIGYTLDTLNDSMEPETVHLTREDAAYFLTCKVEGVIQPKGEGTLGLRIRFNKKRKAASKNNEVASTSDGTPSAALLNRKALQDNPSLGVFTCQIMSVNGNKEVNDAYTAKTAESFKIRTHRQNSKGQEILRTVRLSGKTSVYRVERIETYVNTFGSAEKVKGVTMSKKVRADIKESLLKSIKSITSVSVDNPYVRQAASELRTQMHRRGTNSFA